MSILFILFCFYSCMYQLLLDLFFFLLLLSLLFALVLLFHRTKFLEFSCFVSIRMGESWMIEKGNGYYKCSTLILQIQSIYKRVFSLFNFSICIIICTWMCRAYIWWIENAKNSVEKPKIAKESHNCRNHTLSNV